MIYELFQMVMVMNINYLSSMGKLEKYVAVSDIKAIIHEKVITKIQQPWSEEIQCCICFNIYTEFKKKKRNSLKKVALQDGVRWFITKSENITSAVTGLVMRNILKLSSD